MRGVFAPNAVLIAFNGPDRATPQQIFLSGVPVIATDPHFIVGNVQIEISVFISVLFVSRCEKTGAKLLNYFDTKIYDEPINACSIWSATALISTISSPPLFIIKESTILFSGNTTKTDVLPTAVPL
jgi:hypothetical protein